MTTLREIRAREAREDAERDALAAREAREDAERYAAAAREAREDAERDALAAREAREDAERYAAEAREAREDAERDALAARERFGPDACRDCGKHRAEVYLPDPREAGEQAGYCGLCAADHEDDA